MYAANPYQKYKEQSLSTMAQGELLVKLFDELIKQMRVAVLMLEKKQYEPASTAVIKTQKILGTLEESLDDKYEISANLRDLYIFMSKHIMEAHTKRAGNMIDELIPLVRELRDSFDQADKISRKMQHTTVGDQAV